MDARTGGIEGRWADSLRRLRRRLGLENATDRLRHEKAVVEFFEASVHGPEAAAEVLRRYRDKRLDRDSEVVSKKRKEVAAALETEILVPRPPASRPGGAKPPTKTRDSSATREE